jgi:hypothetical protein
MRFAKLRALRFLTLFSLVTAGLTAATSEVLLENEQVRVLRAVDQPHIASLPHKDERNRVMIYLQAGSQEITAEDGKKLNMQWKAGETKWSPAGGMHTSEITSGAPVTIIEVEIKKEGEANKKVSASLDPLQVDPQDYKLEFENSQVRVTRVKMGPEHPVPMHEHALNRVVVCLTDQNSSMTTPDGKTETVRHKAGEVSWGRPTQHKELNLSDKPLEVVVVEVKN